MANVQTINGPRGSVQVMEETGGWAVVRITEEDGSFITLSEGHSLRDDAEEEAKWTRMIDRQGP